MPFEILQLASWMAASTLENPSLSRWVFGREKIGLKSFSAVVLRGK